MQALDTSAAMAASASTSAGASYAQHDGASTSRAGSSSPNIIVRDTDEEKSDGFDWDNWSQSD